MAGIGAGFGAFADGMSSGYMMGKQINDSQSEREIAEAQREQRLRDEEERKRQTEAIKARTKVGSSRRQAHTHARDHLPPAR